MVRDEVKAFAVELEEAFSRIEHRCNSDAHDLVFAREGVDVWASEVRHMTKMYGNKKCSAQDVINCCARLAAECFYLTTTVRKEEAQRLESEHDK